MNLKIKSTKNLLSKDTRLCALIYSPPKFGKTTLAASLNDLTLKYRGKKSLFIASEAAEGGGTMTLAGKDIDYVMPKDWNEMEQIIAFLQTSEEYGGVVLDNATDWVLRIVKPYALKFPAKERELGARSEGVPVRSDYQVMAECARQQLNKLINLTNENTPEKYRKDLIVTALEKDKNDDSGNLQAIVPELPGALANSVAAMFQSVISISVKQRIIPDPKDPKKTIKVSGRSLHVSGDGKRVTGDRQKVFEHDFPLTKEDGSMQGLVELYDKFVEKIG